MSARVRKALATDMGPLPRLRVLAFSRAELRARVAAWTTRASPAMTIVRRSAQLAASRWGSSWPRTERRATHASSADSLTSRPPSRPRTDRATKARSPSPKGQGSIAVEIGSSAHR